MSFDAVKLDSIPLFHLSNELLVSATDLVDSIAPAPSAEVDWPLIVQLRRVASERITAELDARGTSADTDRRLLGRAIVRKVARDHAEELSRRGQPWSPQVERAHARALENAMFGYGRLQPLFEIPDAENIELNGCDSVMVQFGDGHREQHSPVADTDEELVEAIRFLGESASPARPFDDAHPTMTLALGSKFRLHAIGFGLAHRPSVVIRQHILTAIDLPSLVDRGMLPDDVGRILHAAVMARKSIVISGDQGAGKTTLLRALIASIPAHERFGTLETDYELLTHLQPERSNMLALQARIGLGERQDGRPIGEFSVADLIPEALRQNLSRLIVGEVRGSEAGAMFEALQSGTGAMATTHSHNAASTMDRLAARVAQGGVIGMDEAFRQVAHHIHFIVHVNLVDDTWRGGVRTRRVSEVRRVTGSLEGNRPVTHLLYRAPTESQPEHFHPEADLLDELAPYLPTWRRR